MKEMIAQQIQNDMSAMQKLVSIVSLNTLNIQSTYTL